MKEGKREAGRKVLMCDSVLNPLLTVSYCSVQYALLTLTLQMRH